MKKRKVYLLCGLVAVVAAGGIAVAVAGTSGESEAETVYKETTAEKGNLTVGVTESGSVTIGTVTQSLEFNSSNSTSSSSSSSSTSSTSSSSSTSSTSSSSKTTSLEVEEVYVAVGQTVNEGDALLKFTDDSVTEYREALEQAVTEAKTAVSEAALSAEEQKLSASYSYNLSVATGSVAEETYNATIQELQDAVDDAQEAVDESQILLTYYQEQIDAGVDLSESLADEQENYNKLYTKLQAAKNNYTTQSIAAEKTYKEALLSSENASSQYSVDVSGATNDEDTAQDTLEDAEEALDDFNAMVGTDGVVYAEYSGAIMDVGCDEGDTISSDTDVASYADPEAVTMTVSVSQEDISDIAVGDEVNIELTAYEDEVFAGTVTGIDTSTTSGSSTVSYNVTVTFSDDVDGVFTDMTGNVTFIQKQVEDVLYVSNKTIINEGTSSYVKVKDADGNIEKVEVTTGFSDGINVEITSGLSEGDTVLIESQVVAE